MQYESLGQKSSIYQQYKMKRVRPHVKKVNPFFIVRNMSKPNLSFLHPLSVSY